MTSSAGSREEISMQSSQTIQSSHATTRSNYTVARYASTILLYAVAIIGAIVTVLPFIWMTFSSFKSNAEIFSYPPQLLPTSWHVDAYTKLFAERPFGTWYLNS